MADPTGESSGETLRLDFEPVHKRRQPRVIVLDIDSSESRPTAHRKAVHRGTVKQRYFRGDAAFANPEIYEFLGSRRPGLHDPAPGQQRLAGQDR
jgi:hypothetical protein